MTLRSLRLQNPDGTGSMRAGKILQASCNGVYVLKLQGDVRLTLCTSLDDFIETMFSADGFTSVAIDLTEAEGLDSTTLGLLAKIAMRARQSLNFTPMIVSDDASITRLLKSMCFERIFDIREQGLESMADFGELAVAVSSEEDVKAKVLEAHRTLMGVSDENAEHFRDLVSALESDTKAQGSAAAP